MGHFKEIFKILLVLQILSHALASYGHPDAEVIDFGTDPSRDQSIIDAAIRRGMDGDAVAELLRTKQPVVRVVTTPGGLTKTTTYTLNADGSISSKTLTQTRKTVTYNAGSIPDDLRNSPSGTITRTFTDENGHKVTQTISVDKPKASTDFDRRDSPYDFFGSSSSFPSTHHTRTQTSFNGQGNTDNWPGFDMPAFSSPWGSSHPEADWSVFNENPEVETTTKSRLESWTPKTWNWPEFNFSTTTAKPKILIEPEIPTRKPLPSLEDFLKSQYDQTITSKTPTTTTLTEGTTPTNTMKPIHINLEDLPITAILYNGQPADENILKNLPPHLKPKLNNETVVKSAKIPQNSDSDVFIPRKETNTSIRTYTNTVSSSQRPNIQDLDPQIQETLKRAGISPEDITNLNGDTITKTRTEPDGRTITTTYRVKTMPSVVQTSFEENTPVVHTSPKQTTTHSYIPYTPSHMPPSLAPLRPFPATHYGSGASNLSPISEFLAKLGLTKQDVSSKNGQLTKTIIEENGDILTATFVLSSSMRKRSIPELNYRTFK